MKQTRLSIGCRDWADTISQLGPEAAGVLVYLRLLMRSMGASEVSLTIPELANAMRLSEARIAEIIEAIQSAGYLTSSRDHFGVITFVSQEEAVAIAERSRKRRAALVRKFQPQTEIPKEEPPKKEKSFETEVFMCYTGNSGNSDKKEKIPHTPIKERSHTEHSRAPASTPELACDQLEADYIDVCGDMPPSLRNALREQTDDVREAFYLFCRKKRSELGSAWTADAMRAAWLQARRIPEERRADSILSAYLGGWKTIRDSGSGIYFDKATGRVMSLVRGPVSTVNPAGGTASKTALDFVRRMRRA